MVREREGEGKEKGKGKGKREGKGKKGGEIIDYLCDGNSDLTSPKEGEFKFSKLFLFCFEFEMKVWGAHF